MWGTGRSEAYRATFRPSRHRSPLSSFRREVGIVGMPNAGKSSLFNALTKAGAEAANYPFTTIEPNVAVVPVRDERMEQVAALVEASEIVWDTIAFHDIAGLVARRSKGEGLGNKFLANIRETDAIVHVVRAHADDDVIHSEGSVDPARDIETIETELIYADLEQAERRAERVAKRGPRRRQGGDRRGGVAARGHRGAAGRPPGAHRPGARRTRRTRCATCSPLTAKPVLFVANVDEGTDEIPPRSPTHAAAHGRRRRRGLLAARGRAVRARRRGRGGDARRPRRQRVRPGPRRHAARSRCST